MKKRSQVFSAITVLIVHAAVAFGEPGGVTAGSPGKPSEELGGTAKSANEELRERLGDLTKALSGVADALARTSQESADKSAQAAEEGIRRELEEAKKKLSELQKRLETDTTDAATTVQAAIADVLKDIGNSVTRLGGTLSGGTEEKPGKTAKEAP